MIGKIEYGFGREYLSNWTITEALREVFQNYIDYGNYNIITRDIDFDNIEVTVSNVYSPERLEFLRIGNSEKNGNESAIGHHGEGLKMAFLIFLREKLDFRIWTPSLVIKANWKQDEMIGETMSIQYSTNVSSKVIKGFDTIFTCPKKVYDSFINDIITHEDIIYSHYDGDIVDKPKGNIYSGNLFICNIKNLSNAYNIKPQNLSLDRDRSIPNDFDVEYYTSRINQGYNTSKIVPVTTKELEGKDYAYTNDLTDNIVDQFTFKKINGKNVYINKVDNEHLQNRRLTDILDKNPKFAKDKKLSHKIVYANKKRSAEHKSIKTLLNTFKKKYCHDIEIQDDINIIIKRVCPNMKK